MRTYVLCFLAAYLVQAHGFRTTASCEYFTCGSSCKAIHWNVGYCRNKECWCWKYGPSGTRIQKALSELQCSESDPGNCVVSECDQLCSPLKGHCGKDLCWCWENSKRHSGRRVEKHLKQSKSAVSSCDYATCNQSCIATHSGGGFCKDGQCWCWKHRDAARQVRPLTKKWHLEQPNE